MESSNKKIAGWLLSGCLLVFLMVIIGGITRLTGSGLSITEWNVIQGTLPPVTAHDWDVVFTKYRQSPQFQKVNAGFTLNEFKAIFWWEYLHRLLGRLIGFAFLLPFLYFLITKKLKPALLRKLILLFGLGALQGFLGWFMVRSGLVDQPRVSHYRLAIHLLAAFLAFGFCFHLALGLIYPLPRSANRKNQTSKRIASSLLVLLFVQIGYGALVAGLHAGRIYNTFPKMGERWIPSELGLQSPVWRNLTENITTVQFIHRCFAWLIGVLVLSVWFISRKDASFSPPQKKGINLLLLLFLIQFGLGIFTLLSVVALPLAVLHQAGAFLLFAGALYFRHRMKGSADVQP